MGTQALAVTCSATYDDGLSCGVCHCPLSPTTTENATITVVGCTCTSGNTCWRAVIDQQFAFSYACAITLPKVGATFEEGYFDQTFHDTTKTHEDWHYKYMVALAGVTYGALETWSASYAGGCFHTQQEALAVGNWDLANALAAAADAFTDDFDTDVTFETAAGSYAASRTWVAWTRGAR